MRSGVRAFLSDGHRERLVPGVVDLDLPLRPVDHRLLDVIRHLAGGNRRQLARRELHEHAGAVVGARLAEVGEPGYLLRHPKQAVGPGNPVRARVEQHACAQVEIKEAVLEVEGWLGDEVDHDPVNLADAARGEHFPDADMDREEARPHRLHQEAVCAARLCHQPFCLAGIDGEGLLAQHMFSRFQAHGDVALVVHGGRPHVDDVHIRIIRHLVVSLIPAFDMEGVGEGIRRRPVARAHREQGRALGDVIEGGCETLGDLACAENGPAHGVRHDCPPVLHRLGEWWARSVRGHVPAWPHACVSARRETQRARRMGRAT